MMIATWRGMRERSSCLSSSDSSTLNGPRVFGAPIVDGKSCLVCGTATVARFLGDFPLPRKVNTRIVGMQTMCRESIGSVSGRYISGIPQSLQIAVQQQCGGARTQTALYNGRN